VTALIADLLSWALILIGGVGVLAGGIGVLRLPDVYTRMHAAGITDTLGAGAIIAGLMIQGGLTLITVKLGLILLFLFFTNPTSSFSLGHAALTSGVPPELSHDMTGAEEASEEKPS